MNSNATDPHSLRFSRSPASLPLLSADYFIALLPPIIWSCYLNGPRTLLLILLAAIASFATETVVQGLIFKRLSTWDGSALIEGAALALLFPVTTPIWMILLSAILGNLLFKSLWGGLGKCPVHPAVGAYALLYPFFRSTLTYVKPFEQPPALALAASGDGVPILDQLLAGAFPGEQMLHDLFFGNISGNMGQLSLLLLLGSAIYLILRRHLRLSQLFFTLLPVFLMAMLLPPVALASDAMLLRYALLSTLAGSLPFLTIFPASHPASAPHSMRGCLLFGLGAGLITALLRYFTLAIDGAVYGILIMQCLTPFINRLFTSRHYAQD